MKIRSILTLAGLLGLSLATVHAQFGGMGQSPQISPIIGKLFGKDAAFSATMEVEVTGAPSGRTMTIPAKIAFDHGNARLDLDISQIVGGGFPADALSQMKAMHMDKTAVISRPDKKMTYVLFPVLKSYLENPPSEDEANASELKLETTDLGKETVAGHACVKQKAVVTDKAGKQHEATLWKAADVKDLPVKIEQTEGGATITLTFKNHNLAKPAASLFAPPADSTKCENMMALMQGAMQKQAGGAPGGLPAAPAAPEPDRAPRRPQQ